MRKISLSFLVLLIVSSTVFGSAQNGYASEKDEVLTPPESNVSEEVKNRIINEVSDTNTYQKYMNNKNVNHVSEENVVVTEIVNPSGDVLYSLEYIYGEDLAKNNNDLAYVGFKYDPVTKDIIYDEAIFSEYIGAGDEEYIYLKHEIVGETRYEIYVDENSQIYDSGFNPISEEEFHSIAGNNNGCDDQVSTAGWCEWAINALCAGGTGATCFAIAAALGIGSAGLGGLSLAVICSMIYATSCQATVDRACG